MKYKVKDIRGVVPSYEGFYFVYNSLEEMIYIGTSKNILNKKLKNSKVVEILIKIYLEELERQRNA